MSGAVGLNLQAIRRREERNLTSRVAVDHVEIVCHITTENRNLTTIWMRETAERSFDGYAFLIGAKETQAGLDEGATNPATDAA